MITIIKKYIPGIFTPEQSDIFTNMQERGISKIPLGDEDIRKIYKELLDFFEGDLHQGYFLILVRPWINTLQILGIIDQVKVAKENKNWLQPMLLSIRKLRGKINSWSKKSDTLGLYALLYWQEPDINLFLKLLDEFESVIEASSKFSFERGKSKFSKDKIKKFGIYALFNLAEATGLKHKKSASQLFKMISIITDMDPKSISDYYKDYRDIDIQKMINENLLFLYIYNPTDIVKEIKSKMPYFRQCPYQTFVAPVAFPVTIPKIGTIKCVKQ